MLNLIFVKKESTILSSNETIQYIPIPSIKYEKLKNDFHYGVHLSPIEEIDVTGNGVIIKTKTEEDGLLAASYIYKKYKEQLDGSEDETEEDYVDSEDYFEDDEEFSDDIDVGKDVRKSLFDNGKLIGLPVVSVDEFNAPYIKQELPTMGFGTFNTQLNSEISARKPYWFGSKYPLIVIRKRGFNYLMTEAVENSQRFIIYITDENDMNQNLFGDHIESSEKELMFECDFECCTIPSPEKGYYKNIMNHYVIGQGYTIAESVDAAKIIDELIRYRGTSFASNYDIVRMVNKAIQKKKDSQEKVLYSADLNKAFVGYQKDKKATIHSSSSIAVELEKLVGLTEVKAQLIRIVKRMKFEKQRKLKGYKTSPTHMAAVFMGEPGTAKTTVARIFAKLLLEEGVLENDHFSEISRKDLIGMYVGWTGPQTARVFENARGGTIFIDEAYSLLPDGEKDGYSSEALSEVVRQMENHPETLVIFAGYTDKMKEFIQKANPGLRSRLTNLLEFPNYTNEEMFSIFQYEMEKEDYLLGDYTNSKNEIIDFVDKIKRLRSCDLGNGRLMRKLFYSVVSYMVEREDNDMKTLQFADIQKATSEIYNNEKFLSKECGSNVIGFS